MCIIAIKPVGVDFPSVSTMETMMENNPDGFALAYSEGKGTVVYRTLDSKSMLAHYKKMVSHSNPMKTSLVFHARIKTHGSQKLSNCHGWKDTSTGLVFAHNGILSVKNRKDMTDSETFFRDIFLPIYKIGGWKSAKLAIDAVIGTSKFAFIDEQGHLFHFGQYIQDGGMLYSNGTYKESRYKYYDTCYGYGSGYGYSSKSYGYGYSSKGSYNNTTTIVTQDKIWSLRDSCYYYEKDFKDDWKVVKQLLEQENKEIRDSRAKDGWR